MTKQFLPKFLTLSSHLVLATALLAGPAIASGSESGSAEMDRELSGDRAAVSSAKKKPMGREKKRAAHRVKRVADETEDAAASVAHTPRPVINFHKENGVYDPDLVLELPKKTRKILKDLHPQPTYEKLELAIKTSPVKKSEFQKGRMLHSLELFRFYRESQGLQDDARGFAEWLSSPELLRGARQRYLQAAAQAQPAAASSGSASGEEKYSDGESGSGDSGSGSESSRAARREVKRRLDKSREVWLGQVQKAVSVADVNTAVDETAEMINQQNLFTKQEDVPKEALKFVGELKKTTTFDQLRAEILTASSKLSPADLPMLVETTRLCERHNRNNSPWENKTDQFHYFISSTLLESACLFYNSPVKQNPLGDVGGVSCLISPGSASDSETAQVFALEAGFPPGQGDEFNQLQQTDEQGCRTPLRLKLKGFPLESNDEVPETITAPDSGDQANVIKADPRVLKALTDRNPIEAVLVEHITKCKGSGVGVAHTAESDAFVAAKEAEAQPMREAAVERRAAAEDARKAADAAVRDALVATNKAEAQPMREAAVERHAAAEDAREVADTAERDALVAKNEAEAQAMREAAIKRRAAAEDAREVADTVERDALVATKEAEAQPMREAAVERRAAAEDAREVADTVERDALVATNEAEAQAMREAAIKRRAAAEDAREVADTAERDALVAKNEVDAQAPKSAATAEPETHELTDEEAQQYLANYGDLARAAAKQPDEKRLDWARRHYTKHGHSEGRSYKVKPAAVTVAVGVIHQLSNEEAEQYLANYGDLARTAAKQPDEKRLDWARRHYTRHGHSEGRSFEKV